MLKLYRPLDRGFGGQNIESWEETWEEASLDEAIRWAESCHLSQVFDRYLPKKGRILEGGCGLGHFVVCYRRRGFDIEGVDFASNVIQKLKAYDPSIPVKVGNVAALDCPDNSFDAYYSGGVVEHFEEGPFIALSEAYRVLAPGGKLIITVPYLNPIRIAKARLKMWGNDVMFHDTVAIDCSEFEVTKIPRANLQFCEYYFSKEEFAAILKESGFQILESYSWGVEWGEFCQAIYSLRGKTGATKTSSVLTSEQRPIDQRIAEHLSEAKRIWKRAFLLEDRSTTLRRLFHGMIASWSGHMLLFVCEPRKGGVSSGK